MQVKTPHRLASYDTMQKGGIRAKVIKFIIKEKVQPTYDEYLKLNESLYTGDIPMDKVLDWVMQDPSKHRKLFETALYKGLDQLAEPIPELVEFFAYVETAPDWIDRQKIDEALAFFYRLGNNSGLVLRDVALMPGYLYPGLNQPLIMTGALSKQAGKRIAETTKWLMDLTKGDSLDRFSDGFTSTIYVRFIHSLVRSHLQKSKQWDEDTWGSPINQYDQAMTNLAFCSVLLLGIRAIGIFPTKREIECYLHFWRYAGWLMGIDEKWLIDSEGEGWRYLYWLPFTHPPADESSLQLGKSLGVEPLERKYKRFRPLMQKFAYRQHREMTQMYIGKKKMQKLGLESSFIPWTSYALLAHNLVVYTSARYVPKLDKLLIKHGRKQQLASLEVYAEDGKALATMH